MTAGQVSDYTGAAVLFDDMPKVQWLLGDGGYDATGYATRSTPRASSPAFRAAGCATSRSETTSATTVVVRIEIMFGRLKDWRRVATCYDRFPATFFAAITLAATVIFWL